MELGVFVEIPENVMKLIHDMAAAHPDRETAARAVFAALTQEDFESLVQRLVFEAIRRRVCDAVHRDNVRQRDNARVYGGPAKVSVAGSKEVAQASFASMFRYNIGGMLMADVLGSELEGLAAGEARVARGHLNNVELCRRLCRYVPEDKMVREAIDDKRFTEILGRVMNGEPEPEVKAPKKRARATA